MCNEIISTRTKIALDKISQDVYNTGVEDMFKRILISVVVSALFATAVGAHEPGGFNGKLYAAEVALGSSLAMIPIGFGILRWYVAESGRWEYTDARERQALLIMSTHPIMVGFGTFFVGELAGRSSSNKTLCYVIPTTVSFGVMGAGALIGAAVNEHAMDGALLGTCISVVPNAFLTAYLYNVVKKPKDENANASISISPYLTASRERNVESGLTITCGIVASY